MAFELVIGDYGSGFFGQFLSIKNEEKEEWK
jgi:hypothetical protein